MKIKLTIEEHQHVFTGRDAEDILHQAKNEAANRAPFLMKAVIKRMSDMDFARTIVQRANAAHKRSDAPPHDAQSFLDWAIAQGYVQILEN